MTTAGRSSLLSWTTLLALLLSASAPYRSTAAAQQPIAPVALIPFGDGADSVLSKTLTYQIGQSRFTVSVPAGFVTDFASTPRAIWAIVPPTGRYQLAAVVHDFLYWDQGCTRQQADELFRVAMAESQVKPHERDLMWEAVRRFGGKAWDTNAVAKAAGRPRIIPPTAMNLPALVTWPEYQAQLVAQGVKPAPRPSTPPDYCGAADEVNLALLSR